MNLPVRTASASDEAPVVAVVALAFAADPALRWGYTDPHQYWSYAPSFIRALGGRAFECGSADYLEGYLGAALWLPPGAQPDEGEVFALIQRSVSGQRQQDVLSIVEQMGSFHPSEPHWYLPFIGVDPLLQRNGLGSALMKHALERCDNDGLPAYLEATSPENVPFYKRHGFKALGTIQSGDSRPIVPMLRQPETRNTAG